MKKESIKDVATIVEIEGLGYAITDYLSADSIEDKKLSTLWKQGQDILKEISKILGLDY